MHIVLLNDDSLPDARGGAAVVTDMLRRGLQKHGHTVTFITTHRPASSDDYAAIHKNNSSDIINIPVDYPLRERHFRCLKNSSVSQTLKKVLQNLKPDIVHAHNIHTYLTYDALNIARSFTDRVFLTAHDTFLVSFSRVKTPHRMHFWEHLATCGRQYNPWRNATIKRIIRETGTCVIAISNILKNFLELNDIPVSDVVYNGTEIPLHYPEQRSSTFPSLDTRPLCHPECPERSEGCIEGRPVGATRDDTEKCWSRPTILTGGRVSDDKGMGVFWKAATIVQKEVPDVRFCIVGDTERIRPYLARLPQSIRERTETPGWLSREAMHAAYASCTLVTTPSIYLDPFNLMNIEAMAHGKPVVGTSFGGTPEIVEDGVTGFVRDPRDTERYAAALVELLKNKALAKRMGEAGRKRVEEKFSAEKMVEGYFHVYEK